MDTNAYIVNSGEEVLMILGLLGKGSSAAWEEASQRCADKAKLLREREAEELLEQKTRSLQNVGMERVVFQVAAFYGITVDRIKCDSRMRKYVLPRQVAMYFLREKYRYPFQHIGKHFNGRDHSSVIHAVNTIQNLKEFDRMLQENLHKLNSILNTL